MTLFPVIVLVVGTVASVAAVSLITHRNLVTDPAVIWLVSLTTVAAGLACVAAMFSTFPIIAQARTYRQLELRRTMGDIRNMTWREFEDLVAANYEARGFSVETTGRETEDGGVDLVARKNGETWLVQCKHYQWELVEEPPLRELLGVVAHRRATGGVFVTCGQFTDRAQAFAKDEPKLQLVGGYQLRDMIDSALEAHSPAPACPLCGSQMRRRISQYGAFWGCSNFPACHGKRQIPA